MYSSQDTDGGPLIFDLSRVHLDKDLGYQRLIKRECEASLAQSFLHKSDVTIKLGLSRLVLDSYCVLCIKETRPLIRYSFGEGFINANLEY